MRDRQGLSAKSDSDLLTGVIGMTTDGCLRDQSGVSIGIVDGNALAGLLGGYQGALIAWSARISRTDARHIFAAHLNIWLEFIGQLLEPLHLIGGEGIHVARVIHVGTGGIRGRRKSQWGVKGRRGRGVPVSAVEVLFRREWMVRTKVIPVRF